MSFDELPTTFTVIKHLAFCCLLDDLGFIFTHRILHIPILYKHIHKVHHTYNQTIGITSEYAHPIEFLFGNVLPVTLPYNLLGKNIHFFTVLLWATTKLWNTTLTHSGYTFSWSPADWIPFKCDSEYHDYHHNKNIGNFGGMLYVWDTIFGYNEQYWKYIEVKRKKLKLN